MDFGSVKFKDQMDQVLDNEGNLQTVTSTYTGIGTRGYRNHTLEQCAFLGCQNTRQQSNPGLKGCNPHL